tara:strand:- start:1150 stop:1323 length:174 start_codon:yes stop_codon:yes gene_type:complete
MWCFDQVEAITMADKIAVLRAGSGQTGNNRLSDTIIRKINLLRALSGAENDLCCRRS